MKLKSLMSTRLVSVKLDDPLSTIKDIFDNTKFHHLLVIENAKLLGVISDRDLLKSLSPNIGTAAETAKDLSSLNKKAHQIMHRDPVVISENALVQDAIFMFNEYGVSCIPVVDNHNSAVGIISWRDIMRALGLRIHKLNQAKTKNAQHTLKK
ncbi:CBS domain-containing protein [Gayadomonas joobiniege]|uniref:CBS domain-containing protein n=1 Tax=Gayadomonas joobiniege TaxID=1234606 RepID=UPI00036D84D6|nr:CBS domain-containing protein [Gayadomonas joobiniege]